MFTVLCAGDYCPQKRIVSAISKNDFSCLVDVRDTISDADYSVVNFEAPIVADVNTKIAPKTGPNLKCSINALKAIRQAGFKCVTLANNHFYDYGDQGVQDTLNACEKEGIDYVGGGKNIEEATRTLYKTINGMTLAIVNFCENEWSIATKTSGGSAPLNVVKNYYQIVNAKEHADYVLVIIHGGREHCQLPRPEMKEMYHFFVDAGADAIVNHHQHCFSGYEIYNGKPIFYGLGNFCFDADGSCKSYWQEGYMVKIDFDVKINFQLFPYIQCDIEPRIIPLIDRMLFDKRIKELNDVIANTELLEESFDKWVQKHERKGYLGFIEPLVANRYVSFLWRKGLLPSLWSRKKRMVLLNVIRCESHRDILVRSLIQK